MDSPLKQRLIGAAVLVALAVIFLPMLLKGPDVKEPDAAQVPLAMPATPGQEYETRELPLTAPEGGTPAGGVLGMTPAEPEALPAPTAPAPSVSTAAPAPVAAAPQLAAPAPAPPAPVPNPAPEAPTPAAVAAGGYLVNIGSFSSLANANALVAKLRAQKLPVLADKVTLASGSAMRVRVGPYGDRATAEAARLRAEEVTGTPGKVVASDASAADVAASNAPAPKPAAPVPAAKPATAPAAPAATPAPAAPKTGPANAAGVGFAVQLSAPSKEADANALRDKARAQGFSAFVQPVETDSGRRYRVRVGPVADRAAALALHDEVAGKLGINGNVVPNP